MNEGDVVRLKSGGPKMTIADSTTAGWLCRWFDNEQRHQCEYFNGALLVICEEAKT